MMTERVYSKTKRVPCITIQTPNLQAQKIIEEPVLFKIGETINIRSYARTSREGLHFRSIHQHQIKYTQSHPYTT